MGVPKANQCAHWWVFLHTVASLLRVSHRSSTGFHGGAAAQRLVCRGGRRHENGGSIFSPPLGEEGVAAQTLRGIWCGGNLGGEKISTTDFGEVSGHRPDFALTCFALCVPHSLRRGRELSGPGGKSPAR